MSRLRGLFFSLGLAAMASLMAGEARSETLTLSVFAGTDTSAPALYSTVGGATLVTADTTILNGALAGAGFGAYSFGVLGGNSNNPGSTTIGVGAFILTTGSLIVTAGGSGEGTPITVVLTEGGFTLPTNGPSVSDTATANIGGASSASQSSTGIFMDATGATVNTPTGLLTSSGSTTTTSPLGAYMTPFTLTSVTTLSLTSQSRNPLIPGANGFTQLVSVQAIPEPASLVMMLTGMPLPLVVLGLLRRRRAAA
jgi:hypothetical protein